MSFVSILCNQANQSRSQTFIWYQQHKNYNSNIPEKAAVTLNKRLNCQTLSRHESHRQSVPLYSGCWGKSWFLYRPSHHVSQPSVPRGVRGWDLTLSRSPFVGPARNLDSPTAAAVFESDCQLHILMQIIFKRTSFNCDHFQSIYKYYNKVKLEEIKLVWHLFVVLHFYGLHTKKIGIGIWTSRIWKKRKDMLEYYHLHCWRQTKL